MTKKLPAFRIRFVIDEDAVFEECNGESRPLTPEEYKENEYQKDGRPVSYAEYRRYYGNPDRHVYLQSECEKQCPCCDVWSYAGGVGHIDFMDDSPELRATDQWFTPDQLDAIPGYLRDIAQEDLTEAGYKAPRTWYCQHKGCKYFHVADSPFCAQHGPKAKS